MVDTMEKITSFTKEVMVDEFEFVHTFETLEAFGFKVGKPVDIPGTIFGSRSKNIQWSVTLTYLTKYRGCDHNFSVSIKGHNDNGKDSSIVSVTGGLSSASSVGSPITQVFVFDKSEDVSVSVCLPLKIKVSAGQLEQLPLQLSLSLKFHVMQLSSKSQPEILKRDAPLAVLQSFKDLLESGAEFADVTLVTMDGSIPAHKLVLIARSPVFRAMFSTDMVETNNNRVDIKDFDKKTISAMLKYIYYESTDEVAENPLEMLCVADKYDLKELREVCICNVTQGLKVDNAIQKLLLADRFHVEDFRNVVMQFFRTNHMEIAKTDDFKEFVKTNLDLYLEALTGNLKKAKTGNVKKAK